MKLERILQALLDLTGRTTVALIIDDISKAAHGSDKLNERVDETLRAATEVADLSVGKRRAVVTRLHQTGAAESHPGFK